MRVAAVQFCPIFKDVKGNLRRLATHVATAASNGAQLVVLPELATTGYSMMNAAEAEPLAEVITEFKPGSSYQSSMNVFHALANRLGVHVVWGLVEKDYGTSKLYNSQVLMCPDGGFEFYRKINRWGNDYLWAAEGRANPPVRRINVGGQSYKVGLLICRDVRDKKDDAWSSFYETGDADVVCLSANWGDGGFPAVSWMDFAKDNGTILAVSNRYGKEIPNNYGEGGVCIIYPDGQVQCDGLVWNQDCIVYAEI